MSINYRFRVFVHLKIVHVAGFLVLERYRNDLRFELASVVSRLPSLLREQRKLVTVLSGEVVLFGQIFGGDSHRSLDVVIGQSRPNC